MRPRMYMSSLDILLSRPCFCRAVLKNMSSFDTLLSNLLRDDPVAVMLPDVLGRAEAMVAGGTECCDVGGIRGNGRSRKWKLYAA